MACSDYLEIQHDMEQTINGLGADLSLGRHEVAVVLISIQK
ncbi:hypothetical protein ACIGHN_27385 [Acidovorax sp. NPDC077693]